MTIDRSYESQQRSMRLDVALARKVSAEALGTAGLVSAVIGSGIMAERLSPDDIGLQLLENAYATMGALIGLILMFGTVSGAHFNPIVTILDRLLGNMKSTRDVIAYVIAQVFGGCAGAILANLMFERPAFEVSTKVRASLAHWLSEVVATVTLLLVIHSCVRTGRSAVVPFAVGLWIGGAYFFTSSTSFANPAVTIARTLSDSFAGIAPSSIIGFIISQFIGMFIAWGLILWFYPMSDPGDEELGITENEELLDLTKKVENGTPQDVSETLSSTLAPSK